MKSFGCRYVFMLVTCAAVLAAGWAQCAASGSRSSVAVEAALGAGGVPMTEWQDFWGDFYEYRDQELAGFYEVGLRYHLGEAHALVLSCERLTTEATAPYVMYYGTPEDTTGYAFGEIRWDFEATPISLSYEFYPLGSLGDVSPYFGLGASYYFFTGIDVSNTVLEDTVMPESTQSYERGGRGYGVHAYAGCRARLAGGLYLLARVRGRYADGMGLTDAERDIPIHLSGFDAALGLGYAF